MKRLQAHYSVWLATVARVDEWRTDSPRPPELPGSWCQGDLRRAVARPGVHRRIDEHDAEHGLVHTKRTDAEVAARRGHRGCGRRAHIIDVEIHRACDRLADDVGG